MAFTLLARTTYLTPASAAAVVVVVRSEFCIGSEAGAYLAAH